MQVFVLGMVCEKRCVRYVGYACMYICLYVCMYVCMYLCMFLCVVVCMAVGMYVCMNVSLHVCRNVSLYVCLFVCLVPKLSVCIFVCMYLASVVRMHDGLSAGLSLCPSICTARLVGKLVGARNAWRPRVPDDCSNTARLLHPPHGARALIGIAFFSRKKHLEKPSRIEVRFCNPWRNVICPCRSWVQNTVCISHVFADNLPSFHCAVNIFFWPILFCYLDLD